jgi:hypothetical protein
MKSIVTILIIIFVFTLVLVAIHGSSSGGIDSNENFTVISVPECTKKQSYKRFHIQLFKEPNLKSCITSLKDSPEQHVPIQINHPIKSLRIRSSPNDLWRFTQQFSLIIYLKHDPSYKIELKLPRKSMGIDYKILDTTDDPELLDWMARYEPKIVVFTAGQYYPIDDLDNNAREYTSPVLPSVSSSNTSSALKTDELDGNYFWI